MSRKPYPSDLSEEEWAFVAPYLTLMKEDAPQREHSLREVFNALRWLARAGAPWRMLPNDFPPWAAVYQQFRRWCDAGCFEALVSDMRSIIRTGQGRQEQPSAVVLDGHPKSKESLAFLKFHIYDGDHSNHSINMINKMRIFTSITLATSLFLVGCASMQSHDETTRRVQASSKGGDFKAALQQLDERHNSADAKKEMLYSMERGELLRLDKRISDSTEAFLQADSKVREWEEAAKTNPSKLLGFAGSSLISERLKVYEGQDYEKVWLTTRLALNRVSANDFDSARVDIKRTHEREAVIAELRAKSTMSAEEEAKSKGVTTQNREINGYPVELLNDPEVLNLKNGYQNALSHYLAGYLYEAMNEPGMAAPGYRKAIELRPNLHVLEEGLQDLDNRSSFTWKRRQSMTDVLFIVESGLAPARTPKAFTIPVPMRKGIRTVSISYPVIEPSSDPALNTVNASGKPLKLDKVVDLSVMARRALRDEMPGMVLRGVTRAIAKAATQEQLDKASPIAGLIGTIASIATEQADDRMWRMLPGSVYIARGYLPPGEHQVSIDGREYGPIKIDGQYAIVPLRVYNDQLLMAGVGQLGQLPTPQVEAAPVATTPVVESPAVKAKKASPRKVAAKPASVFANP